MKDAVINDSFDNFYRDLKAIAVRRVYLHCNPAGGTTLGVTIPLATRKALVGVVADHFETISNKMVAYAEETGGTTEVPSNLTYSQMCQWIFEEFEVATLAESILAANSIPPHNTTRTTVVDVVSSGCTHDATGSYLHTDTVTRLTLGESAHIVATCSSSANVQCAQGFRGVKSVSPDPFSTMLVTYILMCLTHCDTAAAHYKADTTQLTGLARAVAINQLYGATAVTPYNVFPRELPLHTPVHQSYAQTLETMLRKNIITAPFENRVLSSVYTRECADLLLDIVHSNRKTHVSGSLYNGPTVKLTSGFIQLEVVNTACIRTMRKLLLKNPDLIDLLPFSME